MDSALYRFVTYSFTRLPCTRGASGLTLQQHWLMMGALEAADGMLLFGISTAFMFSVLQVYWPMLSEPLLTRGHP